MCSNLYNNLGDKRIMKRGINQVDKDDCQIECGKAYASSKMKIETLMRAQAQVSITTPPFPTYDRCTIVHRPGEYTANDELAKTRDENNFIGGRNNSYNQ
ncbi:hypothetical protein AAZX31_04G117100 [Glycine max]